MHSTYIVMDIKAIARWKTNINLNCTSSPEPRKIGDTISLALVSFGNQVVR